MQIELGINVVLHGDSVMLAFLLPTVKRQECACNCLLNPSIYRRLGQKQLRGSCFVKYKFKMSPPLGSLNNSQLGFICQNHDFLANSADFRFQNCNTTEILNVRKMAIATEVAFTSF